MLSAMDAEPFDSGLLKSWRLDDERELQKVFYLPSPAEIAVMKGQIRAEKEAKGGAGGRSAVPQDVPRAEDL
jgi:hypothetical protein